MENELNNYYQKLYDVLTDEVVWGDMKDWWLTNGECEDLYVLLLALQGSITTKEFLASYKELKSLFNYMTYQIEDKENENEKVSDN